MGPGLVSHSQCDVFSATLRGATLSLRLTK
uniref:Uncharacterized protein n=1 Tax=Anguilla anguilla TaxID=7936 RepID=A0A0E9QN54_ANGAN